MSITALPTPPSRSDPANFAPRSDAFLGALPAFATEANALAAQVNADSITAANAAVQASAQVTNYRGVYSAGVTYSVGQSVLYSGSYWISNVNSNLGNTPVEGANWSNVTANKAYSNVTLLDGYTEEVYAVSGTTPALSPTNGSIQTWTLSGSSTPTYGTWAAGQSMILMITAGVNSITWPTTRWSKVGGGGAAPTLTSSGATCVILWKVGSTTYGALLGSV